MENHIEQRLMDPDATLVFNVFDQSKVAKAIHEEADGGTSGADHLCQSFLRNGGTKRFSLRDHRIRTRSLKCLRKIVSMSAAWHDYHAQYTRTFRAHRKSLILYELDWCREGGSNPHGRKGRRILSPLRLPVPPSRREVG